MNMENKPDNQYETLSEAVNALEREGYTDELTTTDDGLFNNALPLDPTRFAIDSFHRFEGPSDPADMGIVYAISSAELGLKGLLVGDYGGQAQDFIHRMVRDLPAHQEGAVGPGDPMPPAACMNA